MSMEENIINTTLSSLTYTFNVIPRKISVELFHLTLTNSCYNSYLKKLSKIIKAFFKMVERTDTQVYSKIIEIKMV